ncbi:RNF213 [Mytilus coruscus]|uniref:RNF213 n=1 Tax=Mytilus coruscus TaxID=42192 RepID=A0A6J8E4B4_MYTCO|nr:RNF213 [Mytilus coruscus]
MVPGIGLQPSKKEPTEDAFFILRAHNPHPHGISGQFYGTSLVDCQQGHRSCVVFFSHGKHMRTQAIKHRYDGIVRGKQVNSKGMFTKAFSGFVNYFTGNEKNDQKLLRKDAESAIKIYTSLLRIGPEDTDKPYMEILDNVLQNLRRRYFMEEYLWSQAEDFEKFAGKVMRPHIQQCLLDLIMTRNQDINVQLQVLCMKTSITVLCLVLSYKVELSAEEKNMLCSSLLPYLCKNTSKCEDMEAVKISVNTTRKLTEQIIALMRSVIEERKPDPCWMFCVPLLHFLQDRYVPYQEVPVTSNHKDGNPIWWGIESFITEKETFKKKNIWEEKALLNDFARKLAPYFQLDYLLPRTLTATFYVTDLNNLKVLGIPEDAVLASLYYHIVSSRYNINQLAVESRDIATKVSTSLCSLTKNKRYSIKNAERLNSIAEDLISVCINKKIGVFTRNKDALISIAEVYFVSVHWLKNGLSLEGHDDNEPLKYTQRIAAFQEHVNLFCKFVKPTLQLKRGAADLEKWLAAWSTPFEMKIPDGDVKNHIDLQLKKLQDEELQKMKYHPNDIVYIYYISAESFPSQTQELLSRYAFKVLDQCNNLESVEGKLQNDNKRQKTFGKLLSNVFERSLDEKKMQDDNNLLFMHALSWAPFATFAKMFWNAKDLEDEILRDYNIKPLCSLVKVELLLNIDIENYQPIVQAFSLDSEILNALSNILECKSKCFMQLLRSNGSDLARQKDRPLTAREVYAEVWKPSYDFWKSICSRLRNGEILFSELKRYFDTRNLEALREIFDQICTKDDGNDWVEQRLHQFKKYTNIRSCSIGARAILKVVETYDLTGDFSQITEIDKLTKGDDTSMNTIDEKLVQTCSILRDIDEVKAECLNIFAESKDLVVWLREAMPAGQKAMKVFVDLASITALEGDIEIAKVNCLHAATTGFAPLIFSLTYDCNEKVFLDKCNEIWKTLSSDCNLGTKLIDTRRQLQWLKSVKKSHGSVEVTSLSQADAINEMGIYKIGNWTKRNINENMTITDVLELILPKTERSMIRRYSFQKLDDLQSRLMLVAGKADKGKESVDRFMLIFDSVVRLGQIYIKLLTDGCVLFSKWYVNLLCDKTRPACVHIHFGEGKNTVTLKGKVDSRNEDVIAIIPRVAKFLEQCHDKWMEYISEKRDKFYLLNYFTIDQMVILQRELVKLGSDKEPSLLIYPLLSAVKSNCTEEELMEAMHSAKAEIKEKESAQNCQDDKSANEATEISENAKTKAFIVRMKKAGYDTKLALQALQHVPSADDYQRGNSMCFK